MVRALEVFFLTGAPLTQHFADTVSPIAGMPVLAIGLRIPSALTAERTARRVGQQFERGLMDEIRGLLMAYSVVATLLAGARADSAGEPPLREAAGHLVQKRA